MSLMHICGQRYLCPEVRYVPMNMSRWILDAARSRQSALNAIEYVVSLLD